MVKVKFLRKQARKGFRPLKAEVSEEILNWHSLMPYPCSHFYFDINFGDRLYSKEKRPGSLFLF